MFTKPFNSILKYILFTFLIAFSAYLTFSLTKDLYLSTPGKPHRIIAITQIAPHPSLDEIRRGIMDVLSAENLKAEKIKPVEILFENAQGNVATATQIATKFVGLKPLVMVPITTPSAQSIHSAAKGHDLPIVFAGISDPATAKLLPTEEAPFITGVSALGPIEQQAKLIVDVLVDTPLKTVGIIFNPGEANSVRMVELITQYLEAFKIKVIQATATNTKEVSTAVQSLVGKVSALYLPNDNTVISALETVLKTAQLHKIPVFSSDPESVSRGCLACIAPDQYAVGEQVGHLVIKLLKGDSIKSLPVEVAHENVFVLNLKVAKDLGIVIKPELIEKADSLIKPLA
ncbi:ABC transporter substrate-binding protein [Candidatus Finniella inopinata]|uniref:ABC transporter substrate-binding protein n=1 Tax=Candidatus Finniella inopinata TaxID=1696036 RepID=A0A4V2DZS1_9PROT|nr:ABC transporter substrate-binding protein [Candidatus Finniella inopinata]RZI46037.1 ABC transporter substrate-binding protein [Candidatus Finniella inopinata]